MQSNVFLNVYSTALVASALAVAGCRAIWPSRNHSSPTVASTVEIVRYPELLLSANVEGRVIADIAIDSTGRFQSTQTRRLFATHDLFWTAVTRALATTRWAPARSRSRPVSSVTRDTFSFVLLADSSLRCPTSTDHHRRICGVAPRQPRRCDHGCRP